MSFTIALFLTVYLVAGYFLFRKGLAVLHDVPGVGLLLMERIVYMIFFLFFLMLVFSNAVLLYSSVFRGKETAWLFTLPVCPRAVFCWKVIESFVVSSWGLVVLSAPLLLSIGKTYRADVSFYLKCLAVYVPFMVLPAVVAGMGVVLLVRWWGRTTRIITWILVALLIWKAADGWMSAREAEELARNADISRAMKELLGHSEITVNRLLPSAWMGEMVVLWARGFQAHGLFYGLLLSSWALMLGLVCVSGVSRLCYDSWNLSQRRKAARAGLRAAAAGEGKGGPLFTGALRLVKRVPFLKRTTGALVIKDIREFTRDPAQWVPCAVVFGLLFFYAGNLNRGSLADPQQHVFRMVLIYMNFGVCSLTLSTLTTRFIFPLFSLEGRRLWIIGLSPVSMTRVFYQKLVLFAGVIAALTCLLMLFSGLRLGLPGAHLFLYCAAIVLMSFGLTSMSLGLGVLFPNYNDSSPARIVSGFGGTLCLILNFVYIVLFMTFFVTPDVLRHTERFSNVMERYRPWIQTGSILGILLLTAVTAGVPLTLSLKRMKKLELLGKL